MIKATFMRKMCNCEWLTVSEVDHHHGGKHGSIQADMVLEKELRVLHINPQAARRRLSQHWA